VEGLAGAVGGVAGGDVQRSLTRRGGATGRPDRPLPAGRDLEVLERAGAVGRLRDDIALVPAAVARQAAELDVDTPFGKREGGALLLRRDVVDAAGAGRIDLVAEVDRGLRGAELDA